MKICPECMNQKADMSNHCPNDGVKLEVMACPACGYSNIAKSEKYCEKCGSALSMYFAELAVKFAEQKSAREASLFSAAVEADREGRN